METFEVDMKEEVKLFDKNWFGMRCHPTDTYIDWELSHETARREALILRDAYDRIIQHGLLKELDILIKVSKYRY